MMDVHLGPGKIYTGKEGTDDFTELGEFRGGIAEFEVQVPDFTVLPSHVVIQFVTQGNLHN